VHFLETVVAVLVGGGLTLLGVQAQLRHDSRERERKRQMSLRRDVYLEVAEAQAAHLNYLIGLGRLDKSFDTLAEPLGANQGWLNKLHVVASIETIRAMTELGAFFDRATTDIAALRLKYNQLKAQSDAIEQEKAQLVALGNQAVAASKSAGFGATDKDKSDAIQKWATMWQERHVAQQQIVAVLRPLIREIFVGSIKYGQQYPDPLAKANIEVRKEIGMPLDTEKYLALVREAVAQAKANSDALIKRWDETTSQNAQS
jgi:hypothetical protein